MLTGMNIKHVFIVCGGESVIIVHSFFLFLLLSLSLKLGVVTPGMTQGKLTEVF